MKTATDITPITTDSDETTTTERKTNMRDGFSIQFASRFTGAQLRALEHQMLIMFSPVMVKAGHEQLKCTEEEWDTLMGDLYKHLGKIKSKITDDELEAHWGKKYTRCFRSLLGIAASMAA